MSEGKKTGLWAKKTKNGHDMLTGSLGDERIMVFKNEFKTEEKHPDYIIKFMPKTFQEPTTVTGPMSMPLPKIKANGPEEELPF